MRPSILASASAVALGMMTSLAPFFQQPEADEEGSDAAAGAAERKVGGAGGKTWATGLLDLDAPILTDEAQSMPTTSKRPKQRRLAPPAPGQDGADHWNAMELRRLSSRTGKPIAACGALHDWGDDV